MVTRRERRKKDGPTININRPHQYLFVTHSQLMKVIQQIYKWRHILYRIRNPWFSSALSVSTANQEIPDRQHLHLDILSTVSQYADAVISTIETLQSCMYSKSAFSNDPRSKLSGLCWRCEGEAAVLLIYVASNSSRKMAFNKSLSHALFSENKPCRQLNAKLKDRTSYISFWWRGCCTVPASDDPHC